MLGVVVRAENACNPLLLPASLALESEEQVELGDERAVEPLDRRRGALGRGEVEHAKRQLPGARPLAALVTDDHERLVLVAERLERLEDGLRSARLFLRKKANALRA